MKNYTTAEKAAITRALNIIADKGPCDPETMLTSPTVTAKHARLEYERLADFEREHFMVIYANAQHHYIACDVLFSGTIDGAAVYPREIVRSVIKHNACAVVLVHNHPSGMVLPSISDKRITARIADALRLIDVRVLDHLIINETGEHYSFAEKGEM